MEEGKDQESIQSNTTPEPGYHIGKRQKHKKTSHICTREPRGQPFPIRLQGTDKTVKKTHTKHKKIHKRCTALKQSVRKLLGGGGL